MNDILQENTPQPIELEDYLKGLDEKGPPDPPTANGYELAPNLDEAVSFLRRFHGLVLFYLCCFEPYSTAVTISFATQKNAAERIKQFILKHNSVGNIYHGVNPPKNFTTAKIEKNDVASIDWLWVDIDFNKDLNWSDAAAVQAEHDKRLAALKAHVPAPTMALFSGGGLQAGWRLEQPIALTQSGADVQRRRQLIEDVEARMKALDLD
jgi:hypothetical protein